MPLLPATLRTLLAAKTRRPVTISATNTPSTTCRISLPPSTDFNDPVSLLRELILHAPDLFSNKPNPRSLPASITLRHGRRQFTYTLTFHPNPTHAQPLRGRVALVTGAARGLGSQIATALAQAGATVHVADLDLPGATSLANSLNLTHPNSAHPHQTDVTDEPSVRQLITNIAHLSGGLDLLVSNAGIVNAQPILSQDIDAFRRVTEVNYTAFAILVKHTARLMAAAHRVASLAAPNNPLPYTDIIQINSKSGLQGSLNNAAYAGSKFGAIGLVKSFAKELIPYRIKINAICPGNFLDSPLWTNPENGLLVQYLRANKIPGAKTVADVRAAYEAAVPMKRACHPDDLIRALFYLIQQTYETGTALPLTGGQLS